jgi:hypothetical protein
MKVDGTYQFYVHHFSGQETLRTSEAKVEVYRASATEPVKTYTVPTGAGTELYWEVFEMTVTGDVYLTSLEFKGLTSNYGQLGPIAINHQIDGQAGFATDNYHYTATVTNDVYYVQIDATANAADGINFHNNDNQAISYVEGNAVNSGNMTLKEGANLFRVYATLGQQTPEQYDVYLSRDLSVTEDVYVEDISFSGVTDFTFDRNTFFYNVETNQDTVTITADVYGTGSTVKIFDGPIVVESNTAQIDLTSGANSVYVAVIKEDGTWISYHVFISRP